jgi:hypothetical protein
MSHKLLDRNKKLKSYEIKPMYLLYRDEETLPRKVGAVHNSTGSERKKVVVSKNAVQPTKAEPYGGELVNGNAMKKLIMREYVLCRRNTIIPPKQQRREVVPIHNRHQPVKLSTTITIIDDDW